MIFIPLFLLIAIGWAGTILTPLPLRPKNVLYLSGAVPKIYLVHCKLERCHDILVFRIKVIGNGNIADAMLRIILLGVVAGLDHITAQAGKVLGDYNIGPSFFQLPHHFLKTRTFKVAA